MWELHDRLEQHVNEKSCISEIDSFHRCGQIVPVLGRALKGDENYDVELIYGARRLFVARYLNKPLLVELRHLTDKEAFLAMDIENRQRSDLSPYERGLSYLTCLRSNLYVSQEQLAHVLDVSPSQISRLIKLAMLPSVVIAAFETPLDICETWAPLLESAFHNPLSRKRVCARARAIAAMPKRPTPRAILQQLISAGEPGKKVTGNNRDVVVNSRNGKPLFRVRRLVNTIAVVIPLERLSAGRLAQVKSAVSRVLDEPSTARIVDTQLTNGENPQPDNIQGRNDT